MAHKKAGGSTSYGRDSNAQRLGVKIFGGQLCKTGSIIVRQRGTNFYPGKNVALAKDHTLFATTNGIVKFSHRKKRAFNGKLHLAQFVHVLPLPEVPKK